MRCRAVKDNLIPYLNGQLTASEAKEIENHLILCHKCSEEMESVSDVWRVMDSFEGVEPSPSFRAGLKDKISNTSRERNLLQIFGRILRPIPIAVAVMLIFLIFTTYNFYSDRFITNPTEFAVSDNLDMLVDYDLINNLELLEDFETIKNLEL